MRVRKNSVMLQKCASPIRRVSDDHPFEELPCLFFGRSIPSCESLPGEFGAREQSNELTHFIDGSNVYGSTEEVAKDLREFTGGLLKVGPPHAPGAKPSLPLLPREELGNLALCPRENINEECYVAGDVRVNEHLGLTVMHTIWMREHNRVVKKLAQISPSPLSDEELYQIGRQVVGGTMQSIIFREYLPEVLGASVVKDLILGPFLENGYDPRVDPSIPNAYATAAFRYGHSLIRPQFARLDENYRSLSIGPLNLLDSFFNTAQYNNSFGTDPLLRGLLTEAARRSDEFLNPVLTTQLFKSADSVARDLASLNINRGRDHGLPPYLVWREFCIKFFAMNNISVDPDFRSDLTRLELLRVYGSLDTVDLFAGGMAEEPYVHIDGQKSILGPTFTCIFIITFRAQASGDRFFFLNKDTNTLPQVAQFKNAKLSKVVCNNADNIKKIQLNAFVLPGIRNPMSQCDTLPDVDLAPFLPKQSGGNCAGTKYIKISLKGAKTLIRGALLKDKLGYNRIRDRSQTFARFLRDSSTCLQFDCPVSFTQVITFPFRPISCGAPKQASGLPSSSSSQPKTYAGVVRTSMMTASNGFYNTLSECNSGRVSAVTYTCGSVWTSSVSGEEVITDIKDIIKAINETSVKEQSTGKANKDYPPGPKVMEKSENDDLLQELDDALNNLQ